MVMKTFRVEKRTTKVEIVYITVRAHDEEEAIEEARRGFGEPDENYTRAARIRREPAVEPLPDEYSAKDVDAENAESDEARAKRRDHDEREWSAAAEKQRKWERDEVARRAREVAERKPDGTAAMILNRFEGDER